MIAIIGNAPSSGSTFLADLLDSTSISACGPELNLFSNKKIYRFEEYKNNIRQSSKTSTLCLLRNATNIHRLDSYGLGVAAYKKIVNQAANLNEFAERFADHFMAFRGKKKDAVFFEKTPQNLNCIDEFLTHFESSCFIHVIRNPLYIYPSLLRRGFSPYIALSTWLIDVAKYYGHRHSDRVVQVKYEDLVSEPFKTASRILKQIAEKEVADEEIELCYRNNQYRKQYSKKMKSWTVDQYGQIEDANRKFLTKEQLEDFSRLINAKVSSKYAEMFNLSELGFLDATKEFGYHDNVTKELGPIKNNGEIPKKTVKAYIRLFHKWLRDYLAGDARPFHLQGYLNPIEKRS